MKKLFLAVLAVAALAACKKDTLIQQQEGTAITFSNAFVDNATRAVDPTTTTANINSMWVWGLMDNTGGIVFDGKVVTKNEEGKWTYSPTQYWFPGHNYFFAAVSPVDSEQITVESYRRVEEIKNGLGTIIFKNNGTTDLLYSATRVSTMGMSINDTYAPIAFTFNHLLSRIRLSFVNAFENSLATPHHSYTLIITDVKIADVPSKASINVAQSDWWSTNKWVLDENEEDTVFSFGNTGKIDNYETGFAENVLFFIPTDATKSYTVTFNLELKTNDVSVYKCSHETTISGVAFEIGKAYNLKAVIGPENISPDGPLKPIEFAPEVKHWDYDNNYNVGATVPVPGYNPDQE